MLFVESNAAVACCTSLLDWLLDGTKTIPEIVIHRKELPTTAEAAPIDIEAVRLNQRLKKASKILQRKREKQH